MLLNLSDVLSEQHRPLDQMADVEIEAVRVQSQSYPVAEKGQAHIRVEHVKDRELQIRVTADISVYIPCARCLEDVRYDFNLDFERRVDLGKTDAELIEGLDESNYIDGYHLDVDLLLYSGILTEWPMKVLCRKECKGICSKCGKNLNEGPCMCEEEGSDLRMSAIREVFEKFKEV